MQLILHAGAHYTEEDRLLKSLLTDKALLAIHGTFVPEHSVYRGLFRDTLNAMHKTSATQYWKILKLNA